MKKKDYKFFDFGKPKHVIFVTEENQNKARNSMLRKVSYNNRKRAAEKRILEETRSVLRERLP